MTTQKDHRMALGAYLETLRFHLVGLRGHSNAVRAHLQREIKLAYDVLDRHCEVFESKVKEIEDYLERTA